MRRFWKMLTTEIRDASRDALLMICGLLLTMAVILAVKPLTASYNENTEDTAMIDIALVDGEDSAYTRIVVDNIAAAPSVADGLRILIVTEPEMDALFRRDEIAAAIVIPEGFTDSILTGRFLPIRIVLNNSKPFQASLVETAITGGTYLMSAVQNAVYVMYAGLEALPLEEDDVTNRFNTQMFQLVGHALSRADVFKTEQITPWRGGIVVYYMLSALLAYLCIVGIYHLYRKSHIQRKRLRLRFAALNIPAARAEAADVCVSVCMIYLPAACLLSVIALLCGFPLRGLYAALLLLLVICVTICSVPHLLLRRSENVSALSAAMLAAHIGLLVLSGAMIPLDFLFAGAGNHVAFRLIPHYAWRDAIGALLTGQDISGAATLSVCLTLVYGAAVFICAVTPWKRHDAEGMA